ncbi:hypothetical protein [Streptacidiphilus sp. P02-A3a]|uniref:hypothetical protein n=1 Tax=Streptacidiphilus sp. P02-A3a TaxID=2704468 RepID=UPI0015F8691A|nr:hypothetical protein [Streptacidiphilus sp. P02-A3a]QMU70159.1 hypothetical protein GXP74_19920 [Streptacidiphilus sp. P02-A3a]QMU70391.1 hypothetical protein GXP74_21435 [Streptacidiphilus sp. P02-A3a]
MGTIKRITRRRTGSAAAVVALAAAALALGAGAASAKSVVDVGVSGHSVQVGRTVQVSASGGNDIAGSRVQLCIDERVGQGGWQTIRCTAVESQQNESLRLAVKAQHRGELQFRSQLVAVPNAHHRVPQQTSATVVVRVR